MSSSRKSMQSSVGVVLLFIGCLSTVGSALKVKNLTVPQTYILDHNTVGAPKPLILDCEYETDPRDTGIVLKWFFNNFPIYQWIPNSHPIPLQKFKPHLDTTFTVEDPKQVYRALSIQNPTWNMTGNYTCSLQSFRSSDQQSAQLIVIEPEKDFDLQVESEDEMLHLSCSVSGIFPKPILSINVNGRHMHGIVTDNESTRPSNGLYEVKLEVSMNKTQIVVPANINCLLEIPATEYMRERTETYNEVTTTTTTTTTVQTLTYRDGESDETNQISRLEAVVGSHEGDGNGAPATTVLSTFVLLLSTMFLRYTA